MHPECTPDLVVFRTRPTRVSCPLHPKADHHRRRCERRNCTTARHSRLAGIDPEPVIHGAQNECPVPLEVAILLSGPRIDLVHDRAWMKARWRLGAASVVEINVSWAIQTTAASPSCRHRIRSRSSQWPLCGDASPTRWKERCTVCSFHAAAAAGKAAGSSRPPY